MFFFLKKNNSNLTLDPDFVLCGICLPEKRKIGSQLQKEVKKFISKEIPTTQLKLSNMKSIKVGKEKISNPSIYL